MNEIDIHTAALRGIKWLRNQKSTTVKDISRSIQALSLWNEDISDLTVKLLAIKKDAFWETDKPILDTARAYSALAVSGIIQPEIINWILEQQKDGSWNNDEIDSSYAMIALGDGGIKNEQGCEWLFRNYGKNWEYVGTTSLIITALLKQNKKKYLNFITLISLSYRK